MNIILNEESDIGVTSQEPEKLRDHSFPVDLLGRKEWEAISEVETKLSSEKTIRHITTSEIFVIDTVFGKVSTKVEVLLFWVDWHGSFLKNYSMNYMQDRENTKQK